MEVTEEERKMTFHLGKIHKKCLNRKYAEISRVLCVFFLGLMFYHRPTDPQTYRLTHLTIERASLLENCLPQFSTNKLAEVRLI